MLTYIIVTDENPGSGILKKARYQVAALNDAGLKSELVIISPESGNREESGQVRYVYYKEMAKKSLVSRFMRAQQIRSIIGDIIVSLEEGDVVYYRAFGGMMYSYIPGAFFRRFRRCRLVSEHNTIEWRELLLEGSYGSMIRNVLFGNLIIGQSDGIVGVTEEITRYWRKRLFYRTVPHVTIPNGFSVLSVPVRMFPPYTPQELHVLFVGNISSWHGLDRFIQGLAAYSGPVQVNLHIVGDGDDLETLKTLAHTLAVSRSVHFHGFLGGRDLDDVFDRCHIAIGSLGVHRKGLKEASALKVREYCSRGIPFMNSNTDPDFPATFTHCLSLPPDDSAVSMDTVIRFYHAVSGRQSHPGEMREYAQEHLDWSVKMMHLKRFIQNLPG